MAEIDEKKEPLLWLVEGKLDAWIYCGGPTEVALAVEVALRSGNADDAQYTHFDCVVSGQQAKDLVRQLQPAVDGDCKVLVGFLLNDLYGQPFVFQNGDKAGEAGVNLKARLLRIEWAKVDGKSVYSAP